jgi:hypothetical protein
MKIVIDLAPTPRVKRFLRAMAVFGVLGIAFAAAAPIDTSWISPGQPVSAAALKGNLDDLQGQFIIQDKTINIPADFPTLQSAWASLRTKVIRANVTIKIADGTYSLPTGGVVLNHPDGALISIVGNLSAPDMVILNATDVGLTVADGNRLKLIDGVRLTGPGTAPSTGISVSDGAVLTIGPNIKVNSFEISIDAERLANLNIKGADINGIGTNLGFCIYVDTGTHVDVITFALANCGLGLGVYQGTGLVRAGSISSASGGIWAQEGSYVRTGNITTTGTGTPFRAATSATMFVGSGSTGTRSPAATTGATMNFGNANGLILE